MSNIDAGILEIEKSSSSGQQMEKKYGADWTKWPTSSHWYKGLALIDPGAIPAPPAPPTPVPPPTPTPPPDPTTVGARSLPQGPFTEHTSALWYRTIAGGTISKQAIRNAGDYGLGLMGTWGANNTPPPPSSGTWDVSDVFTYNIGSTPPNQQGTEDAGIWLGQKCNVNRIVADGTWEGLWIGAQCCDSVITDATVAHVDANNNLSELGNVGIYIEHAARRVKIQYSTIMSKGHGINCEWTYKDSLKYQPYLDAEYPGYPAGEVGSLDIEICYCHITSESLGIFLDAGCCGYHIHHCYIDAPIGISNDANLAMSSKPNNIEIDTCTFSERCTQPLVTNHDAIG